MKKINVLLIAALAFAASARAEVLFVEDFDYPVGEQLLIASDSAWFHQWPNHTNTTIITGEGLTFTGYPGSDVGKALLIEGDHTNDEPHHVFKQVTSGDVFVAFLLQPTDVIKNGYVLTLRDEKIDKNTFNNCGRVYLDWDYFEDVAHPIIGARVFKKADAVYAEDLPLDETKTYLVVLRYRIVDGDHNDETSLYLFDKMPTVMPDKPLIGPLTDAQAPDIHPAHVALHTWNGVYGESGSVIFDGLRIATTFYEALGITAPAGIENHSAQSAKYGLRVVNGQLIITNGEKAFNLLGAQL